MSDKNPETTKEAEKTVQFTSDEIEELAEIQRNYQVKFQEFGKLYVERMDITKRFDELDAMEKRVQEEYINIEKSEKNFIERITKKYGDGTYDPVTSTFTPIE